MLYWNKVKIFYYFFVIAVCLPMPRHLFASFAHATPMQPMQSAQPVEPQQSRALAVQGRSVVATLYDTSGLISIKPYFRANWIPVISGRKLYPGDQIFVGSNGSARLEYGGIGASLLLGPYSLFLVVPKPPVFTRFHRRFGAEQGLVNDSKSKDRNKTKDGASKTEKKELRKGGERVLAGRVVRSLSGGVAKLESFNGMMLLRDVESIPVLWPQGRVVVEAKKFPTSIPLVFEDTWKNVGLWAFLWRDGDDIKPVWTGFSRGSFAAVPFLEPGLYSLQALTEDESRTTHSIRIRVQKRNKLELPDFPKPSATSPITLVLR